jgi:hypothetical protein
MIQARTLSNVTQHHQERDMLLSTQAACFTHIGTRNNNTRARACALSIAPTQTARTPGEFRLLASLTNGIRYDLRLSPRV